MSIPSARTALVEPGLVLGHLNAALRQHGLFFPVDPSTHARCTIGGMAGNNSCGSKSIRYGLMADNVRAIDAILADGTQHKFGLLPDNIGADVPRGIAELIQRLRALGAAEAEEIAARFPSQLRRVGGYNIEVLTPVARLAGQENLARLLVGSEGTLAFSAALELALPPIKPRKLLGICQFPTFRHAMEAAQHIVQLDPEAVELVDRTMIDLGRGIPIFRATIDRMLIGEPDSLLIVEFHGHDDAPLRGEARRTRRADGRSGPSGCRRARDRCRVSGRYRRGARGRPQHHDVDEGRRKAGVVHRGLRGRSRRPRRLHRTAECTCSRSTAPRAPGTRTPRSAACTSGRC